jgi:methyl-accepting chemotaxis protein
MRGALRTRLALQVITLIGVVAIAMWAGANYTLRHISTTLADERGADLARMLAASTKSAWEFDDETGLRDGLELARGVRSAAWVAVQQDGKTRVSAALRPDFTVPETTGAGALERLASSDWLVRREPIPARSGLPRGEVVVVMSRSHERETIDQALLGFGSMLAVLLALGGLVGVLVARRVVEPVTNLTEVTARIVSTNDLRSEPEVVGDDEVAGLARSFREMIRAQRRSLAGLGRAIAELGGVGSQVDDAGRTIRVVAEDIGERVRDANDAVHTVRSEVGSAAERVRDLLVRSEASAAALAASATASEQAATTLKSLGERTNEAIAAAQTLQRAVSRTTERVAAGERSLGDVTSSMERVSHAARDVEGAAVELRAVSSRVREGAEAGRVLVGRFAQGVGVMRASVDAVEDTVTTLASRVREIQGIISVIGDVADQTALLALNASILAAQAGEEGRGFTVVAGAIKDLSSRTRRSTEQIATLIAEIIERTEAAAHQSLEGRRAVEDGGKQALDASTAVEAILAESTASSVALEGIAALSTAQAEDIRRASEAIERAASVLQDLRGAADDQSRSARGLDATVARLRETAASVDETVARQTEKARGASDAVAEVRAVVAAVASSQTAQQEALSVLLSRVEAIAAANARQASPVEVLEQTILALRTCADQLSVESRRFTV